MENKGSNPRISWELSALIYLALPWLIFSLSWLEIWWGIGCTFALLGAFLLYFRQASHDFKPLQLSLNQYLGLAIFALILAVTTGLSHQAPQSMDYVKHHEVWQDLVEKKWPVMYELEGELFFMDYYLAYYLPPAWSAKILGISYRIPTFLWALLGLFLCLTGFTRLFPKRPLLGVLLFFLIAGQDLLWIWGIDILHILKTGQYKPMPWGEINVESQAYLSYIYKGPMAHLLWAPQHALGGWLSSLLVFQSLKDRKGNMLSTLPLVLSFFWSPFVTLGLIPFVLWDVLFGLRLSLRKIALLASLFVVGIPILLYFQAHQPPGYSGFVWDVSTRSNWYVFYLLFLVFELAAYTALVWGTWKHHDAEKFERHLFILALVSLILIPLYHMGRSNDFVMRVCIPAFVIFYSFAINALFKGWRIRLLRPFFVLSFGLGMILPFRETYKVWMLQEIPAPIQQVYPLDQYELPQINDSYEYVEVFHDFDLSKQYLGDSESLFYKYCLKKPAHEVENP